jgi:hypothetical protein
MPLAAVAGRSSICHDGFTRAHYCPTFKAEIHSLAAARRAIQIYLAEPVADDDTLGRVRFALSVVAAAVQDRAFDARIGIPLL